MKLRKRFQWLLTALAGAGLLLPMPVVRAAQPQVPPATTAKTLIRDVELDKDGRLIGQVVDANGLARGEQTVIVGQQGKEVSRMRTDRQGRFATARLRGGVYEVTSGESLAVCRCWATGTAPPAAKPELLLVSNKLAQRGQQPISDVLLSDGAILGAIIAAAIAIPIIIHNSKSDKPNGS